MPNLSIVRGTTSKIINVFVTDKTNPGFGLDGVLFSAVNITAASSTSMSPSLITPVTMTAGTWASGGFINLIGAPGLYQFGVPDSFLASGTEVSIVIHPTGSGSSTNMAPVYIDIELTAVNNQSAAAFMTGINGTAAPANWNLTSIDGSGRVDVAKISGTAQTARDLGASVLLSPGTSTGQIALTSGAVTLNTSVKNGVALANFMFVMTDTSGTPTSGYTVTATRSIDGGAFAACTNAVSAVSNGVYKISLSATDLTGTVVALRFTASGARDTDLVLITTP